MNCMLGRTLLIIDGGQVAEHDRVLRVQLQRLDVRLLRALEDARLLEHVAEVDVRVQERRVQLHRLLSQHIVLIHMNSEHEYMHRTKRHIKTYLTYKRILHDNKHA